MDKTPVRQFIDSVIELCRDNDRGFQTAFHTEPGIRSIYILGLGDVQEFKVSYDGNTITLLNLISGNKLTWAECDIESMLAFLRAMVTE